MAHSKEYVEAIFRAAKANLPAWVWDMLHKKAFPSSGGHAAHRKEDLVEKQIQPVSPSGKTAEEVFAELQIRGEQYSRTEAQYIEPTTDAGVACGACRFFLRSPQSERGLCQAVMGPIAWFGTCQFYISAVDEAAFALSQVIMKQETFQIQTVVFPKARWTLARARAWLREHDFETPAVDETENAYRFRQRDPGDFDRIRPLCLDPRDAAPNLQECRILAFGGPAEPVEAADKAQYGGKDPKRKRRRMHKEAGFTEEEIEIEMEELMKWFDPEAFEKQEEAPARALSIVTDAPVTNEPWNSGPEVAAMDAGRLKRSTLAFTGGDPEVKGNYKLPYRDRRGRINANAVRAIMAVLGGGRGGVDLPRSIAPAVRRNAQRLMDVVRERVRQSDEGVTKEIPILKVDEEKQVVYGVVLDPYIVDTQGDWIPPKEVEETAHKFMKESRTIGLGHKGEAQATPVESFMMPYPSQDDYRAAMSGEPHKVIKFKYGEGFVHSGSWVLGTMVDDPSIWEAIKAGELGSYSIGGHGEREEMDLSQMPKVTEEIEADFSGQRAA